MARCFTLMLIVHLLNQGVIAQPKIDKDQFCRHIKVIREFKGKRNHKIQQISPSLGRSITESYLSIAELKQEVMDNWQCVLEAYPSFLPTIIEREKEFSNTHYVFYHAQTGILRIVSDIITKIYNRLHIKENQSDFNFLRLWYEGLESTSIQALFDEEDKEPIPFGGHWDIKTDIAKKLLSVNLSLFGNCTWTWAGECTFHYFIHNYSIKPPNVGDIISKILHDFEISDSREADTHILFKEIFGWIIDNYSNNNSNLTQNSDCADSSVNDEQLLDSGLLMQIFIPKNKVDQYAYLSHPCGIPYTKPICPEHFNAEKKRHTNISPILEKYLDEPTSIEKIDKLQARIMLSQDMVLNPESGVKIFRYSLISDKKRDEYGHDIEKAVDMLFDASMRGSRSLTVDHPFYCNNLINKTPLAQLFKFMRE